VVGVAAVAFGLCCHSEHVTTFDRSANGQTVTVAVGEEFEIALDSVGPGRFASPSGFDSKLWSRAERR
jgi:hypothetical protein